MIITRSDYNTMPEQVQENKDNIEALDTVVETVQADLDDLKPVVEGLSTDVEEIKTNKPVYAGIAQTLTPAEQLQARQNIGAGASGFSGDYNDLLNQPIENADLNNIVGEQAGHTYMHTGTTNATFVKGYLYFWTGTEWKLISNFNDLKQAQDDISSLNSDVQTIDNNKADKNAGNLSSADVTAWKSALSIDDKAEKDASNLTSADITSWKTALDVSPDATKIYDGTALDAVNQVVWLTDSMLNYKYIIITCYYNSGDNYYFNQIIPTSLIQLMTSSNALLVASGNNWVAIKYNTASSLILTGVNNAKFFTVYGVN